MKNFYYKLGRKRFLIIAAVLLLCGDLFFSWTTISSLGNYETFKSNLSLIIEQAQQASPNSKLQEFNQMPETYLKEIFQMARNMLLTFCALIVLFHLLVYVFLILKKTFSHYYAVFLSFVAFFFCFFTGVFSSPLYLIPAVSYAFVFMGLMILGLEKQNQESQSS